MPRLPPGPAEGVFAAIEVDLRCGPGAQARPETRPSRESINERIFRTYPRGEMELFCGAANSRRRQGNRVPGGGTFYSRRRRVNRPLGIALRGQIRVGSSGEASPQGETGASQWSRHNCPRRNHESARPVCATVTPRCRSFRPAIGRTSYLTAASYRSATYSQFTRLSTKALR
jgi:hypothetical protein